MDKDRFIQLVALGNADIAKSQTHLLRILKALAVNFKTAWDLHAAFLKGMKAPPEIDPGAVFEVVVTLVAGGTGGTVAHGLKEALKGKVYEPFLVDGIKDVTKLGVKSLGGLVAPHKAPDVKSLSSEPGTWDDALESWAQNDIEYLQSIAEAWMYAALHPEKCPGFKMDFDPYELITKMLVMRTSPVGASTNSPHFSGAKVHANHVVASKDVIPICKLPLHTPGKKEEILQMLRGMFGNWLKNGFNAMPRDNQTYNADYIMDYAKSIGDNYNLKFLQDLYKGRNDAAVKKAMEKYEKGPPPGMRDMGL